MCDTFHSPHDSNIDGQKNQSLTQVSGNHPASATRRQLATDLEMFELTAFSDADHAGYLDTRKITSRGIQFLGDKLVRLMSKKQDCTAMIHKDGDGDASFQLKSDSLPHAHAQSTKTFYKHQDSRIMKAQELKTKTSAQTLIYKIFLQRYQVYQGRLLASIQDDTKYEHVGQDTRSQGGKDDQDGRIKRQRPELNNKRNLIDLTKECRNELTSGEIVSLNNIKPNKEVRSLFIVVILNGVAPLPTRTVDSVETSVPPTTAEQKLAKKNVQLEIHGETISQEDVNLKLLRSPTSEWKTHTLIWRNKPDLEDLSMDNLYNNLKIYEAKIMGSSSTNQNTQNVAFLSSNITSSTNEAIKTAHGVSVANSKNNASTLPNVDSLSDVVI
ncbi:hypothetical protein Tco_0635960 [Tanacetum coccineum]